VTIHLPARRLAAFRRELLKWFRAHRRALPWRVPPQAAPEASPSLATAKRDGNSYRIWLSEVMLQQTRISAVIPYYQRFTTRFPTAHSLANAREHEVLRHWAGLGYYSRARNLHRAAREIVERHGGEFPRTHPEALALPGVGTYMAAAVLSMAYDAPHAVVDGNVARVLARLGAVRGDLRAPRTWKRLSADAQTLLTPESAGDWNEAMMELGETICTPRTPGCAVCPVARFCSARKRGLQNKIPAARRKREPVIVKIAAAVLLDPQRRTALVKDPGAHDAVLFSRMWQFPAAEVTGGDPEAELRSHLAATLGIRIETLTPLAAARHAVTFRNITLLPFLARLPELPAGPRIRAIPLEKLSKIPVSSATRKIAAAVLRMFPTVAGTAPKPELRRRS
jgi:A/G-specific adenine glycosylase